MSNEDGSLWIVFNGEIYNFQDLRTELEKKGHVFKSRSDTEVILHAYEAWDVECLTRFRGMFSFALWDSKQQRLFVARDRLGKKPLVYFQQNGRFLFASEIKAILEAPGIERRVDPVALHYYLTYQYIPSPYTIFDGIKKLPPGHYLLYDRTGHLRIERYWKLDFPSHPGVSCSASEWGERLRTSLEESIRLRLISDVPIGVFLVEG
jgi:asparagine synthase (glutamine-hydrolysing)